jgi:hypothetical protein
MMAQRAGVIVNVVQAPAHAEGIRHVENALRSRMAKLACQDIRRILGGVVEFFGQAVDASFQAAQRLL